MDIVVQDNPLEKRYVATAEGERAGYAEYELDGDTVTFTHTVVDDAYEGRGVGSALARTALDAVRRDGPLRVVPQCPFIRSWIEKHPDYRDLVAGP